MHARADKRQEEHGEQLRVDAAADFLFRHADILHDAEARLILIALGHLFII